MDRIPVEYRPVSIVAILGSGPLGASLAHRLAERGRVRVVRLIDTNSGAAAGKALDIAQSGPVQHFDTRIDATDALLSACGAAVIVVADDTATGEWEGERGLALVAQLVRAGTTAPLVFAGPRQAWLIEKSYAELKVKADRLVGTAASAMVSAARAWAGVELGLASVELTVVGRPPAFTIGWSAATSCGSLVSERLPAHRLLALSASLTRLWPPGPLAIAAATAPVVEALVTGSRRLHPAMTLLDGVLGARGRSVMLPLELGHGRVLGHVIPSLSPQERTDLMNGIAG
jgi:malate dehydrogenase